MGGIGRYTIGPLLLRLNGCHSFSSFFTFFYRPTFFFLFSSPLFSSTVLSKPIVAFSHFLVLPKLRRRAESRSRCSLVGDVTNNRNKNEMPRRQEM